MIADPTGGVKGGVKRAIEPVTGIVKKYKTDKPDEV